ncbi:MAG: hypothetical protein LBB94_13180 [Clostridiales bacterium]|nr:hypothetical protein [Clostridiales bacterium]
MKLKFSGFWSKYAPVIICVLFLAFVFSTRTVLASGTTDPDSLWKTVTDLIEKWVTRLGAVVMFVGGVMFGLGWKNDDAEGKSRGVSTMVAGGIVIAVAAVSSSFLA